MQHTPKAAGKDFGSLLRTSFILLYTKFLYKSLASDNLLRFKYFYFMCIGVSLERHACSANRG